MPLGDSDFWTIIRPMQENLNNDCDSLARFGTERLLERDRGPLDEHVQILVNVVAQSEGIYTAGGNRSAHAALVAQCSRQLSQLSTLGNNMFEDLGFRLRTFGGQNA